MNLAEVRKIKPALAGLDDQSLINSLQRLYYPKASIEDVASSFGYKLEPKDDTIKSGGILGDTAIGLAKGVVAIPQAVVGVGDLVSGGSIGKAVQDAGVDFNAAQENLDKRYSPAQQKANEAVSHAEGFWDTLGAMAKNPSTIYQGVLQSAPLMVAGGYLGGGAQVAAKGLGLEIGQATAAALGEGVSMAGSSAEQIRTDKANESGELTPTQSLYAAGVGILGGGIAKASGALANREGVGYIAGFGAKKSAAELAQAKAAAENSGLVTRIAKGMGIEGAEEVAQSVPETAFQNLANEKEWDKGMGSQLAGALLTGAAMGGAGAPFHGTAHTPAGKPATPPNAPITPEDAAKANDQVKIDLTAEIGNANTVDGAIEAFTASVAPPVPVATTGATANINPVDAAIQDAQIKTETTPLEAPAPNVITPETIANPASLQVQDSAAPSVSEPAIETPQAQLSSPETPQNEFRALGSEAFNSGIKRVAPANLSGADKQSWLGGWDAAHIASPNPFTELKTEKEATLSQSLKAKKKAKLEAMLSPEQIAALDAKPATTENAEIPSLDIRYGKDHTPLHEGGRSFKTKDAAKLAKLQQPMMRVVKVKGGFALAEKTPAQLAAHEAAGRRLGRGQVGTRGTPLAAHEFIASHGGLAPSERADMGMEGNHRIGNRSLFAGAGRGMTIEQATEKLMEDGYLQSDDHNAARELIKRSLTTPQYTAEGFEHMAQREADARFEDYLQSHQEESQTNPDYDPFADSSLQDDFIPEDMQSAEFNRATKEQKAEVAALADKLAALGYDSTEIIEDLLAQSTTTNEREFYAEIQQHFEQLVTGASQARGDTRNRGLNTSDIEEARSQDSATQQGSPDNNGEGSARQSDETQGSQESGDLISSYTPQELRAREAEIEKAEAAAVKEEARLAEAEKKAREDAEIKARGDAAADRFELGGNAMDELSGQTDLLSAPQQTESQQEEPTEVEYNGNRIYKTNIKVGDKVESRWAIESKENKARREAGERAKGGDTLHKTLDEAKVDADLENRLHESRQKTLEEARQREQKEAEAETAIKSDTYNGFLDGLPENRKALIRKALDKKLRFSDGSIMTLRERVESLKNKGVLEVKTRQVPAMQEMSRTAAARADNRQQELHAKRMREAGTKTEYTVNDSLLGKTAYDYASYLLAKESNDSAQNETPKSNPTYEQAKARADAARERSNAANDVLQQFPKGAMGLTPDDVKASPEWKTAKRNYDAAFKEEREANSVISKNFKKESAKDRDAQREATQERNRLAAIESTKANAEPVAVTQPEAQPNTDQLRAQADLQAALADLGDILIQAGGARYIVPQQEQKLLPVLVRLFDAGFRLGYYKFKDLAKFALDQITAALGKDAADSITIDHLQGAYISMGKRDGGDDKKTVVNIDDKKDIEQHVAKAHNGAKDSSHVPNTNASEESNISGVSTPRAVGDAVQNERGEVATGNGNADRQTARSEGDREQGDSGVQTGSTVAGGERSDQLLRGEIGTGQSESGDARTDFGERSGDSGITGVPPETIPAKSVVGSATTGTDEIKQKVAQKDAPTNVEIGSLENVRETLPALLKNQQEDVHTAETRFAKPDGYGMLFTNGTGTGKTFVGLGVVKRFALQGKTNTLIVVPDAKIAEDWAQSGKLLGLNILPLPSTADAGRGIVVTTYANLRANDSLAKRTWDLVISDEAHELMSNAQSEVTATLKNLRAITNHPDGASTRFEMLFRKIIDRAAEMQAWITAQEKSSDKSERMLSSIRDEKESLKNLQLQLDQHRESVRNGVAAAQGEKRTRAVFLSATPFAYEKNIQWAAGYLFEYPATPESLSYNQPDGYQQYMIENFGYRMKFNKLTEPDAKVNRGLMQRQFNTRLKKEGVLSGRMLDVVPDYDRRFVLVDSAIGNKIDEAMDWLKDETAKLQDENKGKPKDQQTNGMALLRDYIAQNFDYLSRRYLLEGIKAKEAVAIVKSHMALGRKVVVFHDYKKGDSKNPFDIRTNQIQFAAGTDPKLTKVAAVNQAITAFRAKFPELVNGLNDLDSPIETFKRELPETLLVNGNEKRSDLLKRYKHFQDDSTGALVMLVQSAKNKGWSGHDTTGVNQRVLINLGQPTAPTLAIQQEGRIYRTGQFSNAIMRYLNTGTNWEKWAFATTIASRASTAENLGMGESSRALKDSFINAFEESDRYPAGHEGEGTGGKERDKAANNALSEFDRAKSYYFSQLKKTSKTKAQEGADYFATPEPLGMKMAQWLDTHAGDKTLEPSAGHGAISRFLSDESDRTVIEPSTTLRSRLALVMNPAEDRILDGSFEDLNAVNKFDGIVMNPPFGVGGKTAIEHVAKAATHLRDGGRIVALIPSGGMADKRLEQWLYGETEKPIKPLFKAGAIDIYKGDTLHISDLRGEFTVEVTSYDSQNEVVRGIGTNGRVIASGISGIERIGSTGARTESIKNAPDLHLIADIKLPSSTFERAGTSVSTHVIVLQKGDTNIQQRNIDLTNAEDINDLFDKIEDVDFAKREQVEQEAPKLDSRSAVLPNAVKPAIASAETGDTVTLGEKDYPIEVYTTNAGKKIRGAWVDSRDEALKHGASTFAKGGKWFVRERDFPKNDTAFSRGGIWRSALSDSVEAINAKAQSEEGWRLNILGLIKNGKVKADEVEWSGVTDWLKLQTGKVTKEQVMDYLNARAESDEKTGNHKKPEEIKRIAISLYKDGLSSGSVAKALNLGESSVLRWIKSAGITRSSAETKGVTQEKIEFAVKMYADGESVSSASKSVGIGGSTLHRILVARELTRSLEETTNAPDEVKRQAIDLFKGGLTSYEVADAVGVSQSTVSYWVKDAGVSRGHSDAQALRIANGRLTGYGIKSKFESQKSGETVRADSVYELARFYQLESDSSVASFKRAIDRIPYGDGRHYVPDIEVTYTDGGVAVEEIKPEFRMMDDNVIQKSKAAQEYYLKHGIEYRVVNERDIGIDNFDKIEPSLYKDSIEDRKKIKASLATVRWTLNKDTVTDKMREQAADGLPMFKKQASTGMSVEAAQAIVDKLSDKIDVTVVATPEDLPVDAPSDAKGLYHNGKAWIVASNNANAREVAETYAHEVIGHYGLRNMLGREAFAKTMGLIQLAIKSGNKPLNAIRDQIRKTYVDENGKFNLTPNQEADEIAAAVAQNAIDENGNIKAGFGFMKAVYAKIAQFLRDMGIDIKFTNAELQGLLTESLRQLGVGEKTNGGNVTVLSRKFIQTNTEAFKRWFGDSKVVDADGKPLVVYHGTNEDITQFDPSKGRQVEGVFMTPEKSYANAFGNGRTGGGNVMPLYASIKNPRYISLARWNFESLSEAMSDGKHDGVIVRNDDGSVYVVVAKNPSQIKSATGNNGNFDPTNPDIRYSRDLLTPYTEAEARAKQEREEQALKDEQRPLPNKPAKKVTADQTDMFDYQGGLFSRSPLTTSLNNAYGSIDGLKERTTALANDLFSSVGTVSWWDKTVGTMQNLAKRSPAFNRVYEATQNFLGDVSTFATNASKLAPSLLPTLDNMRDLVKPLLNAKDKEATARAVWEGTLLWARDDKGRLIKAEDKIAKTDKLTVHDKAADLLAAHAVSPNVLRMWQGLQIDEYEKIINGKYESEFLQSGVVFTDKELRDKFGMSDKQVELYHEFRAATDKSLTDMAHSEMTRLAGKDGVSIEGLDLEKASEKLRDHLMAQSDEKPDLLVTANKIIDIANNTNKLIKNGYAPLMRFGHYTLDVMVDGEREYFGLFESKFEANKMARIMQRNYPDGVITQGTMNDQAYKEFEGISPETAEIYGKILGLDSQGTSEADKAHREFIKASTSNRSALRRLLHRKGIAGFNEDIGRVLAGFVYSNSRRSASNINTGEIKEAIQAIPKSEGELGAMATKLREYVQNPQEEAQALRGLLFMQYIGGSIASAMVNLTQPFSMTFPFLAQYGGVKKSAARMIEASKLAISNKVSSELAAAIEKAKADGHITPQEVHTLMSQAQGRMSMTSGDGTKAGDAAAFVTNGLVKTMFAWGRLFAMAEVSNRKVTFIAAYNTALEEGIHDPYHFAINAINETQGVYNKANKPQWARGAIGSTLFTFKQYSVNYVELFYRLAFAGKEGSIERKNGRKAAILMAATLFLMAGAGGLPFAEDIDDLIDGLMESIGYSFSSKQAKHKFFAMFLGQDGAKFMEKGVSGITGMPIDVSRLGMGNLIPATGLLIKKQDHGNDVAEIFGAAGDLAKRAYAGAEKAVNLDMLGAAKDLSPRAISNALQGADMAKNDMYRDSKGNKVIETDLADAAFKTIGFQPNDVATVQESNRYKQKIKDQLVSKEAEIADKMAQAMFERDQDKRQEANEQLRKWNEDNPDLPIKIKQEQILRRVLSMRQTREQRIMKSAPKEIRAVLRSEQ
jgi:transposase